MQYQMFLYDLQDRPKADRHILYRSALGLVMRAISFFALMAVNIAESSD